MNELQSVLARAQNRFLSPLETVLTVGCGVYVLFGGGPLRTLLLEVSSFRSAVGSSGSAYESEQSLPCGPGGRCSPGGTVAGVVRPNPAL
ncbi:hypothetical protein EA462_14730 [Natrarchaeobius halalkaliphilus]|uniref:Uncharacterized protein n=1 Tax=Natrarchaeobius halalkaliphilus TaxID=1679091 RepID=A0A3N6LYT9_9EURY|nr:hypothetical protein EA462_14730 [Natrarchaeobius halalkaliphilus]